MYPRRSRSAAWSAAVVLAIATLSLAPGLLVRAEADDASVVAAQRPPPLCPSCAGTFKCSRDKSCAVCGEDRCGARLKFKNLCSLVEGNCANPKHVYNVIDDDECEDEPQVCRLCGIPCTDDYTPVCGEDKCGNRKTFSNACELRSNNCNYPQRPYELKCKTECRDCPIPVDA